MTILRDERPQGHHNDEERRIIELRSADEIAPTPREHAQLELEWYARTLFQICHTVRTHSHAMALGWLCEWRMHCFERGPDGRYYLLDRDYQPWRGHRIALTREELTASGADDWNRLAIRARVSRRFVPMEAVCFRSMRRLQLRRYTALVDEISDAFSRQGWDRA